jgi:hypothetical protein
MLFDLRNNVVSLNEKGLSLPEFRKLKESVPKETFDKAMEYIYFVYDKASTYAEVLPADRKEIVCKDRWNTDAKAWVKMEKEKMMKACIDKFIELTTTSKERLLYGAQDKIAEYLEFWKDIKIEQQNHDLIASSLDNANNLLKLLSTIEKQVLEEKSRKTVGGGEKKMFEN